MLAGVYNLPTQCYYMYAYISMYNVKTVIPKISLIFSVMQISRLIVYHSFGYRIQIGNMEKSINNETVLLCRLKEMKLNR